jgi:hypothetical protein
MSFLGEGVYLLWPPLGQARRKIRGVCQTTGTATGMALLEPAIETGTDPDTGRRR